MKEMLKELKDIENGILGFVVGLQDNEPTSGKYLVEIAEKLQKIKEKYEKEN